MRRIMMIVARDVMKADVVSVQPDTPLSNLEDTLIGRHISGVPVIENDELLGIVSRSDIVRYFTIQRSLAKLLGRQSESSAALEHQAPHLTVKDIMAESVVVVGPDTPISEVAKLMVVRHVHRLLVTEGEKVLGVISALDLAHLIADERLVASKP